MDTALTEQTMLTDERTPNPIVVYTIQETAELLRVHRATISRMIHAGEMPCIRVRSRKLIREQDLRTFIDNQIGMTGESS